jgi:hypothetical protein
MDTLSENSAPHVRDIEIRAWLDQVDALLLEARSVAAELTAEQFNWRAAPRSWSVGQCLEHVTLTARLYLEPLDGALEEARRRHEAGARPYREGWFTNWFVRSMEPPPKLRIRTFGKVEPRPLLDPGVVMSSFEATHRGFADRIGRAEGAWLAQARIRSPFVPLLQFTLRQVCGLNLAHGRRHVWQGRQVRASPSFPG